MKNSEMALNRIRQARGLSIRVLAEPAGVHYVTLARIEAGIYDPRLTTLRKLAVALGAGMKGSKLDPAETLRYL